MDPVRSRSTYPVSISLFGAAALLTACQSAAPRPNPEQAIADAVGVSDAIVFQVEGGPIDVTSPSTPNLTLAEALQRALRTDSDLQGALARVRSALADADQARLLPNPVLNLIVRVPEAGGTANLEVGAAAELSSLLQRPRKRDAADNRLRSSVAEAVASSLAVAARLQEQYAAVQALDELMPLLQERRALLGRLIALTRSKLDFGEASRLDVTRLETQGVELDLELAEREADMRDERLALARLIGQPSDRATWLLEGWPVLPELGGDEKNWLTAALERRPEIQARRWELAALGDDASLAGLFVLDGVGAGIDAQRDGVWSVGPAVTLPLPLFDAGNARRAKADAAIIEARHGLVSVQRSVIEEVRRSFAAYRAARANLERIKRELMPLQRQRRDQVEALYLAKEADVTAVLLAEQDLQADQGKLVELEKKAVVSLVRLERAVGGAGAAKSVGQVPRAGGKENGSVPEKNQ